jgi:hypothetical protein
MGTTPKRNTAPKNIGRMVIATAMAALIAAPASAADYP